MGFGLTNTGYIARQLTSMGDGFIPTKTGKEGFSVLCLKLDGL